MPKRQSNGLLLKPLSVVPIHLNRPGGRRGAGRNPEARGYRGPQVKGPEPN